MKLTLTFILSFFFLLQISSAQTEGNPPSKKTISIQNFFQSTLFLRRVFNTDGSSHFEACDRNNKICKVVTRKISAQETQSEQQHLEKEMHYHFRRGFPVGTVLLSDSTICTEVGIIIAAVPGLAGGAMLCVNAAANKTQATELPINIQALNRLATDLGETEIMARGEDGEVYVGNVDLIIKYLKTRYPIQSTNQSPTPNNNAKAEESNDPSARN